MTTWTDERDRDLVRLWGEGRSAAEIADHFSGSGISRSAVLGRVAQRGLTRTGPSKPAGRPRTKTPAETREDLGLSRPPPRESLPPLRMPEDDPETPRVPAAIFNGRGCKWPIGDPRDPDFGFCGVRRGGAAHPYCAAHARIAYQPSPKGDVQRLAVGSDRNVIARRG